MLLCGVISLTGAVQIFHAIHHTGFNDPCLLMQVQRHGAAWDYEYQGLAPFLWIFPLFDLKT